MYKKYFKRSIDFIITLFGFICISPLFLVLCLLVKHKLGSPIFFKQVRIGKDEKPLPDTDRFAKFGDFLRNSSLDELPELINVIKGDMSLVGPRPLYPFYLPYYTPEESLRHTVRGGITGLAQINGRALCRWDDRFAYDCKYVKEISLINDVKILWRTFFKVARQNDIGIPSVTEEGGLHLVRKIQRPEKIEYVEKIRLKWGGYNVPHFNK